MDQSVTKQDRRQEIIASLVIQGDLSKLPADVKIEYYKQYCESLGLNPLSQPFNLLKLQGKEILYANKNCGEQLRKTNGISF